MNRIRIGNDFDVAWAIYRGGIPEDFTTAISKKLTMEVYGSVIENNLFTITGNIVTANMPKELLTIPGDYRLVFEYTLPDAGQPDGDLKCTTDVVAFRIVRTTANADPIVLVNVASDVAIAFKGDKGDIGVDAYQIWLDMGNTGTYDDYIAWQRAPAVDAASTVDALETQVSANEVIRQQNEDGRVNAESGRSTAEQGRVTAEGARVTAETARESAESSRVTTESGRVTAETARETAETTRQAQESDRVTAEDGRATAEAARVTAEGTRQSQESSRVTAETARVGAETTRVTNENTRQAQEEARQTNTAAAILNANTAADTANTAAAAADDARLAIQDELALKADETAILEDEEVVAHDLNSLAERVNALELAFRNMTLNKLQTDTIDVLSNLNFQGRPLIIVASTAPDKAPDGVPQFYVNTTTGDFYSAKASGSVGDWILK